MDVVKTGSDRLFQKQAVRLQRNIDRCTGQPETGTYDRYDPDQPEGRQYIVKVGDGELYGDIITPSALSKGQQVAIYGGELNLFDAL